MAAARNRGLDAAAGAVTVFLDSGVLLHSGALAAHLASHQAADGPLAVCGYVYCFNEDNEDAAQIDAFIDITDPDGSIGRLRAENRWLDIREEWYEKYTDDFADLPAPWLVYWTCNVSASTERLREIGGFDENYRAWGAEDVDLGYRLHRAGSRFTVNRDACAIHAPHPKSYTENMRSAAANYRYFAEKYDTPITALVPDNHFFVINDLIREQNLPGCAEYLATPDPDAGRVLVFSPHPDDETIACGGAVARLAARGHRVGVVFATDGSRSHSAVLGIDDDPTPEELAVIRHGEALAATGALGVAAEDVSWLGYTDTLLSASAESYGADVAKLLGEWRDVTRVYLPHPGRELNADHRCTGEMAIKALAELGLEPEVFRYVVWDERTEREFEFVNRGEEAAPEPDGERLVVRDIAPQVARKLDALSRHATQVSLYSAKQQRTVVPAPFLERLNHSTTEEFWTDAD